MSSGNPSRGRGQGRRARRRGNIGRHTRQRNAVERSRQQSQPSDNNDNVALAENSGSNGSSINIGTANSQAARQTFMSSERNRERVLQELTGISDDARFMMDGNFQEFMSHRREYMTLEQIAEMDRVINRMRTTDARDNMSQEEANEARERNRQRMQDARDREQRRYREATARSFPAQQPPELSLEPRNNLCKYGCKALRFKGELDVGLCCTKGRVVLGESQQVCPYPDEMKTLLLGEHPDSRNFFEYIRRYNSALGFASLGANAAPPPGRGPYCYRIHGAIYHRSVLLNPEPSTSRQFGQIYILEGDGALQTRLNNNTSTLRSVMLLLQNNIIESNPYAAAYNNLHAIEQEELQLAGAEGREPESIRMIFSAGPDRRRYNAPTHNDVAAVFVGEDGVPGKQEFCVYPKASDTLHKIEGPLYCVRSTDSLTEPVENVTFNDMHS